MQISRYSVRRLTAAVLLACGSAAWADDPNPYYIGGTLGVTHESNVFRTPNSLATSDTYTTAGLFGGVDQPFGRQRFYANGNVRYNRYSDHGQLDNTNYGLTTGLDLSTANHISGGLTYTANQGLYTSGGGNLLITSVKNVEKSQQTSGRLSWGLVSLWSLDANANHRSLRYSTTDYSFANLDGDSGSLGMTYRPSGLLSVGLAYRISNGKYPVSGRSYHRNDVDLTSTWVPTGQSTVTGRVSTGRQKYNTSIKTDTVNSGSLSWDYRPTGKLGLTLWASRDTGAESSFFNFATVAGATQVAVGDNSTRTTMLALNGTYAVTGKINLTAGGRYIKRTLDNSVIFTGVGGQAASGSDNSKIFTAGASYQALRYLGFQCNVLRETRSSNGQLSFPYTDNQVGCSASITLK